MRHAHWLLAAGLIATAPSVGHAQTAPGSGESGLSSPRVMVGFVVNGPDQLLGAGGAWLPRFLGGWGLYLDHKRDADSPADASASVGISAEDALEMGDSRKYTHHSYTSVNVAVVRAYGSDVAFYLGGGISDEAVYAQFFDPTLARGSLGHYWARYAYAGGVRPNVLGGMFFRIGSLVAVQFGVEAVPPGMTIGIHLAL